MSFRIPECFKVVVYTEVGKLSFKLISWQSILFGFLDVLYAILDQQTPI